MLEEKIIKRKKYFQFGLLISIFALALSFLPDLENQASASWKMTKSSKNKNFASSGVGNETDITASDLGTVYVAFQDKKSGKRIRIRKLNGKKWTDLADGNNPLGLISQGEGSNPSIASRGEQVYATFTDQKENNRIRVKRWDGISWNNLSDESHSFGLISLQGGEEPEIEFDKSGDFIYVAFRDEASGGRTKVMKWNESQWEEVSDENNPNGLISSGGGAEADIVASKIDNSIYLTYEDVSNNLRLIIKKFDGNHWATITDANHPSGLITETPAYSPSIDVDSQDHIYVVYTYKKEGTTYILYWNGSNWNPFVNGIVARGKTIESTVKVDESNNILVAMSQRKKMLGGGVSWGIRVRKWSNDSWKDVKDHQHQKGFLSKNGKGDPALTLANGRIYISFTDYNFSKKARVMFY